MDDVPQIWNRKSIQYAEDWSYFSLVAGLSYENLIRNQLFHYPQAPRFSHGTHPQSKIECPAFLAVYRPLQVAVTQPSLGFILYLGKQQAACHPDRYCWSLWL